MTQRSGQEQNHVGHRQLSDSSEYLLIPPLKYVTFSGVQAEKVTYTATYVSQQIAISCTKLNEKVAESSHHFDSIFKTGWKRRKM